MNDLERVNPKEVLLPKGAAGKGQAAMAAGLFAGRVNFIDDWGFDPDNGRQRLIDHFGVGSLEGFGIDGMDAGVAAGGALFSYLMETPAAGAFKHQEGAGIQLEFIHGARRSYEEDLELLESSSGRRGTLLNCIDDTVTSMGARRIKAWLVHPLLNFEEIISRHEAVEELAENYTMRERLRENLKGIYDLERLMARIASGVAGPRDLAALKNSLGRNPGGTCHICRGGHEAALRPL